MTAVLPFPPQVPSDAAQQEKYGAPVGTPSSHQRLLTWVEEVAALTRPDRVVWCDGSEEEWRRLTDELGDAGTFVRLDPAKRPDSFACVSDPGDVARVEERTYICSREETDAGPTNNWRAPELMKREMTEPYHGCMRGRTIYVIPFLHGFSERQSAQCGRGAHRLSLRRRVHASAVVPQVPDEFRRCRYRIDRSCRQW